MSSALCIHGKFGKYGKTRVWKTLLETMGFLYKEKEIWETESKKQSVKIGCEVSTRKKKRKETQKGASECLEDKKFLIETPAGEIEGKGSKWVLGR